MRYLLDTTFLIDYLRGDPPAMSRFAAMFEGGDQLLVNEVVVCEVAAGVREGADVELLALLEPLEFIQPGPDVALVAGRWRQRAWRTGSSLSLADALIAAAALASHATVLTRNVRGFAQTPALIESY